MILDATLFIQKYVEKDFIVRSEQWSERNDEVFQRHLAELNNYYFGNLQSNINRVVPTLPAKLIEGKEYLKTLQQKKVFQVKEYSHYNYEKLYCAYLSSDFIGGNDYFIKLYFAQIDDIFKIISEYFICYDCNGTGIINNEICKECEGYGWIWQGGERITVGKPLKVKKILKPLNESNLKEFEAD